MGAFKVGSKEMTDLLTELSAYLKKRFICSDAPADECDSEAKYIIDLFKRSGWKSPEECKSRADGFISTHEAATNAVREQTNEDYFKSQPIE